jgi:5-oxoprolinase (ATP-hydrolysing) subunit C
MGLKVIDPGFWTTVQDAGRVGYREWGVPIGGTFDRGAADLANAFLGNGPDAAVLELTLRGGTFEATGDLGMAVAGAPVEAVATGTDGRHRALRLPSSFSLRAGDRLVLGRMAQGARAYLAVKHGFQTVPRLGSRSTEEPLKKGDVLPTTPSTHPTRRLVEPAWSDPTAKAVRIIAGPDASLGPAPEFWRQSTFHVGSRSNRMGLRMDGPPVEISSDHDRLSAPVAPGAVQVAGGQLIILGVACGTMGGYPHVAHVISVDLDRVGQLRPGDPIRLETVSLADARQWDRARRKAHRSLISRVASLGRDS